MAAAGGGGHGACDREGPVSSLELIEAVVAAVAWVDVEDVAKALTVDKGFAFEGMDASAGPAARATPNGFYGQFGPFVVVVVNEGGAPGESLLSCRPSLHISPESLSIVGRVT